MVISHICTQSLSLHWTLDQLAGSLSCTDTGYCVTYSFVCHSLVHLFVRSFVRSFVRPSVFPIVRSWSSFVRSFFRSFIRSIIRSFVRFLFSVRCFALPFSPVGHSKMVSPCLVSSRIPTNNFFHFNRWLFFLDIPSPNFVRYIFSTNHEATHDGHSAAKTNWYYLSLQVLPRLRL